MFKLFHPKYVFENNFVLICYSIWCTCDISLENVNQLSVFKNKVNLQISLNITPGASQVFMVGVLLGFFFFFNYKLFKQKLVGLQFSQVLAELAEC